MADLLIQWEDLYRQGQDTPADVLCKDHPELAATLARQIAALKRVAWLDKKLEDDGDDPDDPSPDDPRPPRLLAGRYRLDELIATGGFAEVWRAFDQELQRIIAVKIPKRTVIGAADSFLAEARRVARLKHPAILPIHDVGLEDNECFFVSEYVEGGSLADRLLKGNVAPEQACRWITSIADALDHAHSSGVIHRDIKPGNILIDAHDRALLADFGIAQSSMKSGAFAPSLGTLRYMAPEQLDGQEALPQSDIYSLGVVLHEALTGKPPYSSGEPNNLRREIASGAQISRDVPKHLAPALKKSLHKDPGQRHGSAAEFATAIRPSQKNSPWLLPLGAAIAAAVVAFMALRADPPPPPAPSPPSLPDTHGTSLPPPTPQRSVLRQEMPFPIPPFNRREWVATSPDRARTFRFDPSSGWWSEFDASGRHLFLFTQTRLTDDHVDLAAPDRPVWIRLSDTQCEICDTPSFEITGIHMRGSWANEDGSPFPPELDAPVTFRARRDTLERFLVALSEQTGIPIVLNVTRLQLQGITKNQSFGLEVTDQPAREVLQQILKKADPNDRLRAVLRGTDDGSTTIEITTKQALGE